MPGFSSATYYSYDIHGNVDTLLQDYGLSCVYPNMMNANGGANRWKKFVYKYDLISGKVNMVQYQPGWGDQWIHRYSYDAENRLTLVETSNDSLVWETDARYEYYKHGPLARMVIGDQLLQGIDYAYTLQGWLKGTNSTAATAGRDMGGDGQNTGSDTFNRYVARDIYSYTLNYFAGDYIPINSAVAPFPGSSAYLASNNAYRPLYNGNISSMATHLRPMSDPTLVGGPIMLYNYRYDQLNRLTAMDSYNQFNSSTNSWTAAGGTAAPLLSYNERVSYDANGNILKYLRNANTYNYGPVMDSLTYRYFPNSNKLKSVHDSEPASGWGANDYDYVKDIDDQPVDNYAYDAIGNLVKDSSEKITSIKWSVYGKILEINKTGAATNDVTKIEYRYDAMGNRIGKIVSKHNTAFRDHTWYVRDAQGNPISTYTGTGSQSNDNLSGLHIVQTDRTIYGSSRLGVYSWYSEVDSTIYNQWLYLNNTTAIYKRGWRQYELTNHLGNVLATITDKKNGVALPSSSLIDYYEPALASAQDYYPFGMLMPKRSTAGAFGYRYGFNGKENDNDVKGLGNQQDYGMRIYDNRLGRFLSVDPLTKAYPWYSPYLYAGNKPVWAQDLDGKEEWYYYDNVHDKWKKSSLVSGPLRAEKLNKVGYFHAAQVIEIEDFKDREEWGRQWVNNYHAQVQAAIDFKRQYLRLNNPVGIFLELNPIRGVIDAYSTFEEGHYLLGSVMVAGSVADFHSLLRAGSKAYGKLATSIASKYSMSQVWEQFAFFRGMLVEAKVASKYIKEGYEWLAATTSPFFRTFDFYNSKLKSALSIKSVNAEKNFDFKNIYDNIEKLGEMIDAGKSVQFGKEYVINEVKLEIIIPKGYDKSVLEEVRKAAKNRGVKFEIIEK